MYKLPLSMRAREVIAFKDYFENFLLEQPKKAPDNCA